MPLVAQGRRTTSTTSTNVVYEIIPPTGKSIVVKSVRCTLADTTPTIISLGLAGAIGVTPTTPAPFRNMNGGGVALTTSARAWGTPPTISTAIVAQFNLAGVIGSNQEVNFGDGFVVPAGSTFVVYSNSTTGLLDITVIVQE